MTFDFFNRERKAKETVDPSRVPPGQVVTQKFPILHYGSTPRFNQEKWDLKVFGLVDNPLHFTHAEFRALPTNTQICDIHCVTRWSKLDTTWEGVSFRDIAALAGIKPEAKFVLAHCEQGYTANIPLSIALDDDVMLAYKFDNKDLEPDHGFPLRLLVPKKYFWKSAKWLRGLEFMANDKLGYWEQYGYSNHADPWKEERYTDESNFI